jgi:uncharacterized protein (TIGR00297 family)
MQFLAGFLLALVIAAAALATRSLSRSGAIAATGLGTLVFGFGGWNSAAILLTFFITSSLLGKLLRRSGRQPAGTYAKGSRRDAGQVLGNGLASAIFALLGYLYPGAAWPWAGFAGSIAAVNADTWGTELGALSASPPRLITRLGQHVRPGTSGGVSVAGTAAAVLGAGLVASVAALVAPDQGPGLLLPVTLGGVFGALLDSLLGATFQAMYVCTTEHVETEQHPVHHCGAPTARTRGWPWLGNDLVNLACGAAGGLLAALLTALAIPGR